MLRWRVVEHGVLPSTNDEARRLAEAGERGPLAVVAREQTRGHGRRDRAWVSAPGGLYLSALVHPDLPAAEAGRLPLTAGLAMARVVEDLGLRPELRWPNDLFVGGRKAGGALCECRFRPGGGPSDRPAWAILGVGLNASQDPASVAGVGGITLQEACGRPIPPKPLQEALLRHLAEALGLAERSPADLVGEWSRRSPMLGQPVKVLTTEGSLDGLAQAVEPTGALVVKTPAGTREIRDPDLVRVEF